MQSINNYPLWTAIITPFNDDLSVDYESFKGLLFEQKAANNAVVLLGSTGEALALNENERKRIVEFAIELDLQIPLMVGVGGIDIEAQKDWVNYLNTQAIDALLVVTPLYAKPGKIGQQKWFQTLLDQAQKPCMLYNVPSRTGIKMNFAAMTALANHPQFWAIKEASGSVEDFQKYVQSAPKVRVYSGDDGLLPDFSKNSTCAGLVSVASNVWPQATHRYVELCLENNFVPTENWPKWAEALFSAANPIPAKAIIHNLGRIKTGKTRQPLCEQDLESIIQLQNYNAEISDWLKENS